MSEPSTIRSAANPVLRQVRAVAAGRHPELLLLEGDRLIAEARGQGLEFEVLLFGEHRETEAAEAEAAGLPVRRVEAELLGRISSLRSSPGSLALVRPPAGLDWKELDAGPTSLVAVAAGIGDPGNLGALARAAEAAGASALVVTGSGCSPWNEKALRGSMGSLLRLPVAVVREGVVDALARLSFRQVRAATRGGVSLDAFNWSGPVALWLSSETGALPPEAETFEGVSIPMARGVESLNVAAAAAVLLFAAGRTSGESP